jgi:hypothetical protein
MEMGPHLILFLARGMFLGNNIRVVLLKPRHIHDCCRSQPSESAQSPNTSRHSNHYPNPGYLGASSHIAIFNHILSEQSSGPETSLSTIELPTLSGLGPPSTSLEEYPSTKQGAFLTKQLFSSFELNALHRLVLFWRAKKVNLAVAGPFVDLCAESLNYTSLSSFQGPEWHLDFAASLLRNTAQPLEYNAESNIDLYSSQFLVNHTRWETFGIFLSAAIQATRDISFFPPLYATASRNRELRRLLTKLNDCALEVCLSTDNLNDLQLVLQYESFIIHSYVNGDQSKPRLSDGT